jgi:hypothetical protein
MNANAAALADLLIGCRTADDTWPATTINLAERLDALGVRAPAPTEPMDEIAPEDRAEVAELERVAAIRNAVLSWPLWQRLVGLSPVAFVLAEHLYAQGIRAGVPDDEPADEGERADRALNEHYARLQRVCQLPDCGCSGDAHP